MFPRLYAIMDAALLRKTARSFAEMLAQSGVELIQYRDKLSSARKLFETSQELVNCLRPLGARLVVNDRPDIAALTGAGGVHVGQEDLGVEQARVICGPGCWVGVSTHTLEQLRSAETTSADYVAVGPIFPTATKEKRDPVVGVEFIRRARELTRKPLIAIGGITVEKAGEVFRAGADSVAVARDLLAAEDPGARVREYLAVAARITGESAGPERFHG